MNDIKISMSAERCYPYSYICSFKSNDSFKRTNTFKARRIFREVLKEARVVLDQHTGERREWTNDLVLVFSGRDEELHAFYRRVMLKVKIKMGVQIEDVLVNSTRIEISEKVIDYLLK